MKTSSYSANKVGKKFEKFFDKSVIDKIGKSSGFIKRKPQKISAFAFVAGFIETFSKGINTYSVWAANIGQITGKAVSKQALSERMTESTETFAAELFAKALSVKLRSVTDSRLFKCFNRVLLQDSTTIALPQVLNEHYPGNTSRGEQKAVARLQCIINIVTMQWLYISLDAFTNNDQSASRTVLPLLKKGDLLLRDLGYFVLESLQQVIERKAFFISRLRYGIILSDERGKELSWKELCRRKKIVDRYVWIGRQKPMRVRIVIIPLPAKLAAEKIRKASNDRDKRLNHSNDYYQWLQYNVFITNVDGSVLEAQEIAEVYKVRWQIEIIFKSWKSGFKLQQVLHSGCTNIYRVNTIIYMVLMYVCIVIQKVYQHYYNEIKTRYKKELSLMKLAAFATRNIEIVTRSSPLEIKKQLAKHCCYERRNDRINMTQLIINLKN